MAHEAVLYGAEGSGSELAHQLAPVVHQAARWSGLRVPDVESPEASAPHALVIDDLLLFRQVALHQTGLTPLDSRAGARKAQLLV